MTRPVLAALVRLAMFVLAPSRDVPALAEALAEEARSFDEVIFGVGVVFRESSNRLGVVGDGGRSLCAYQLQGAPRAVLTDARLCTRIGLARLRASWALCPDAPLAAYAGVRCGSVTAKRISRDRWRVGAGALRRVGVDVK